MKKELVIICICILVITSVSASIIIEKAPKQTYKLADKIDIDISINPSVKEQVMITADLLCSNFKLNYFKTLFDYRFDDNYFNIPTITVTDKLLGSCYIDFKILTLKEEVLETKSTSQMEVTNQLVLNFTIDKTQYYPGESVLIDGKGEKDTSIFITLNDGLEELQTYQENLSTPTFSTLFKLDLELAKGTKKITITATDKNGNSAQSSKELYVLQVPRTIELTLDKKEISPFENITFFATVFDQSSQAMAAEISYQLLDPQGNLLESFDGQSEEIISYALTIPPPGDYLIHAFHKNLKDTDKVNIQEVKEIDLQIKDGIVTIKNIGNVKYVKNIIVNATQEATVYQIPLSLNLNPGERVSIDLRNELPQEKYNVAIASQNQLLVLDEVPIDDNRPIIKKVSQKIAAITGATIIETDNVGNIFYLILLIIFVGFIIVFLIQKRLKTNLMKTIDNTVGIQNKRITGLNNSLQKGNKEKTRLRDMFSTYVDKNLLHKEPTQKIVKKEISILFTDIREYSKIFDSLDSEDVAQILNLYFSKTSEIIKKHNGFINKFIGDSVMALFNAVVTDQNHTLKAIRAALEIKEELIRVNRQLKERNLPPIKVGIGIDTGVCAVGNFGSKEKTEYTAVGTPLNIAFRLQSISDGEILITQRTFQKIKDKIKAEPFGDFEMKNITGKVRVYKVLGKIEQQ